MKLLFLLVVTLGSLAHAQLPRIWELTGGNPKGIGHGYNIRTMRHTDEPLLLYNSYNTSILVNGQRYSIPYEAFGQGLMRIRYNNDTSHFSNFEDYFQKNVKLFGISVGLSIYGVGVEVSYMKLKGEIQAHTKNFTWGFHLGEYTWQAFELEIDWADTPLDPDFLRDVKSLPTTFDRTIYRRFIAVYGTHIFSKVTYGCRYNYTLSFNEKFFEKRGSQWTAKQIGVSVGITMGGFGIKVGFNQGSAKNVSKVDGDFLAGSKGFSALLGGDETLYYAGLDKWYPTCVKRREVLLAASRIVPIAELIKKSDPVRYAVLVRALQDYARNP